MSAELQIVPTPIARVLEEAHVLRENYKRVLDRGGAADPDLEQKVQQIFDDAWAAASEWHGFAPATQFAAGPAERAGGVPIAIPAGEAARPFERAPAAGEPGGPQPSDTLAEINAQAEQFERLKQPGEPRPEAQAATQAVTEAVAEAEGRASAIERAAYCITRG